MFAFTKLMQAMVASGSVSDPQFYLTTLLLNTSSTNGAQNNTFLDSSSNNFTITRNGNTTQGTFTPFSQTGWSNYLNGSSDYLSAASNAAFAVGANTNFTFETWIYLTSTPGSTMIYQTRVSGGLAVTFNGGVLSVSHDGVSGVATYTYSPPLYTWIHIAVVRNGTGASNTVIYVNGVSVGTGSDNGAYAQGAVYIGYNQQAPGWYFPGYISNLRLVNGSAVYTGNFTPPTTPLTAITNTALLTCQSNRFLDNSTNAFTITPNGTPSVQAFSPFAPTAAYDAAVVGGSGYFDGSGDYLNFTDSANDLDLGGLVASFEAWVYPTSAAATQHFAYKHGGAASWSASNGIEYAIAFDVNKFYFVYNNGGSPAFITGATTRQPYQWHHVVVATDASNNMALFVNGVREGTATNAITKPTTRTTITIGVNVTGGEPIFGYVSGQRFIKGSGAYDPTQSTITVPTAPPTAITNTKLLLNFTNGGIYDSAAKNVLETVGNAQVSTTQAKWGTTSMYFDGTGDYLTIPNSPTIAVGSGDFAIECWWYPTDLSASSNVWCLGDSRSANNGLLLYWSSGSGKLILYSNGAALITSSINTTTNAWYYINVVRSGSGSNNLTLYINGSSAGTATNTTSFAGVAANGFAVCAEYAGSFGAGKAAYFDDVRITKGYARPSTSPTAAFPLQ